jgi:hypothetical protein
LPKKKDFSDFQDLMFREIRDLEDSQLQGGDLSFRFGSLWASFILKDPKVREALLEDRIKCEDCVPTSLFPQNPPEQFLTAFVAGMKKRIGRCRRQ